MTPPEKLKEMIRKANRMLAAARRNYNSGDTEGAVNRAYYAVFHAISALLLNKGLTFSSHSQTIGAFTREFVKTGVFPKEFNKIIDRLFTDRMDADYKIHFSLSKSRIKSDIDDAKKVLEACEKHLEETTGASMSDK